MTELPEKPSDLIELALADLRKVEKDERYVVNMRDWHAPAPAFGFCNVCLAGAVMAGTLGHSPDECLTPGDLGPTLDSKLRALDSLRLGRVRTALDYLGRAFDPDEVPDCYIPQYSARNPEPFHAAMGALAQQLRALGH